MMGRKLEVGSPVIYVDEHRRGHHALVTVVWEGFNGTSQPGCNLVYISSDEDKKDPYGRQIERATSVVHLSGQPAGGRLWCWPDEAPLDSMTEG